MWVLQFCKSPIQIEMLPVIIFIKIEYIIGGVVVLHVALAFINTVSIREAFWISSKRKVFHLLINWLVFIFGPAWIFDVYKNSHKIKEKASPADNTGTYYANSISDSSDGGGGE